MYIFENVTPQNPVDYLGSTFLCFLVSAVLLNCLTNGKQTTNFNVYITGSYWLW